MTAQGKIKQSKTFLGIGFGSTRIKVCFAAGKKITEVSICSTKTR